jgi:hypothetical protein
MGTYEAIQEMPTDKLELLRAKKEKLSLGGGKKRIEN